MKTADEIKKDEALSNLLAVLHRDGGHYESKHGTLKAIEDALSQFQQPTQEKEGLSSTRMLLRELWFQTKTGQTISQTFLNTIERSLETQSHARVPQSTKCTRCGKSNKDCCCSNKLEPQEGKEDVEQLADDFVRSQPPKNRGLLVDGWMATGFVYGYNARNKEIADLKAQLEFEIGVANAQVAINQELATENERLQSIVKAADEVERLKNGFDGFADFH